MRNLIIGIVVVLSVFLPSAIFSASPLYDDFNGDIVSASKWHIPTWVSSGDGSYVGRTQYRVSQNSPLSATSNGAAIVTVETYNPTGYSFYGTDLISNYSFSSDNALHITVRAKLDTFTRGIVAGIFLYDLKPGSTTLHNEIDFELITNFPNGVQTNIYSNEPLDEGHPKFILYKNGSISDFHTYEIKWQSNQVSWFVDDELARVETNHVPNSPMHFHLNIWVPDSDLFDAYNPDLVPADSANTNQIFSMSVDSVDIQSISTVPAVSNNVPILDQLILDE